MERINSLRIDKNSFLYGLAKDRKSSSESKETIPKHVHDLEEKDSEISELKKKIEGLEKEKSGFITEFEIKNKKIKVLSNEIEDLKKKESEMKKEIAKSVDDKKALESIMSRVSDLETEMKKEIAKSAKSVDDKKALESIMSRVSDLETEVSRLQHDLISTMSENEEARGELQRVKNEIHSLKQSVVEKDGQIEKIEKEKEKVSLQKKIDEILNELKTVNDVRSRDLVDRDMKFKEKENEFVVLEKMVKKGEMEKSSLEEELKISEEKFKEIEVDLSEKVINELKEKNVKFIDAEKGNGCSKLQWPACVIASTGTVAAAAAALFYFTYAKRR